MTDLRAPDPTLVRHSDVAHGFVAVDWDHRVPVAHRVLGCGWRPADGVPLLPVRHVAYIAVPCRECFPAALEPGTRPCTYADCIVPHCYEHLAWQVNVNV